jgi:NAD(P)H-flavin reductase
MLQVARVEAVGAYTLLVLRNDGGEVGAPGQFFMLQADPEPHGAYLPRALSAAWADAGEIAFLLDVRGAGTAALAGAARVSVLVRDLPDPVTTLLGFREQRHAVCAALIDPDATVVLEPTYVTEPLARLLPADATVYACGPDPMLHAVAALCAEHAVPCLLAMEAAMACGFGACYGCAVEIDGEWKRLCVEGPVLEAGRVLAGGHDG